MSLLLTSCVSGGFHGSSNGDVSGALVEHQIDTQLTPGYLVQDPGLHIGRSKCPSRIDLSPGHRTACVLAVEGQLLRVAVIPTESGKYDIRQLDALLKMADVEKTTAAELFTQTGVELKPRCGAPRVRVLIVGTRFRCAIAGGPAGVASAELRVVDARGRLDIGPLPGIRPHTAPGLQPYLAAHAQGRNSTVPGPVLAPVVRQQALQFVRNDPARLHYFGSVLCPARSDLSGAKHTECRLRVATQSLHLDVMLDDRLGVKINPHEAVIESKRAAENARAIYQGRLSAAGISRSVAVDCGSERILVLKPGEAFRCTIRVSGRTPRPLIATVSDASGELVFNVPDP